MQWDELRLVLTIHRQRTLSAAARELGVNHSTVSRRLAGVEQEMAVRLFDKLPTGYVATAAGEEVVRVALAVEEQVLSLDRNVLGQDERLTGTLRVTTVDILGVHHIEAFGSFCRRYPGIELELSADNAMRSLTRREADVALRFTNDPPPNLVGRRIQTLDYALYGARTLLNLHPEQTPIEDLPWMAWDERLGARVTEAWMRRNVPRARIACRVDSSTVMLAAINAGMGIGFLPVFSAEDSPALQQLRPVEPGFAMDLWLLTHEDLRRTARVRAFMEHLAQALTGPSR